MLASRRNNRRFNRQQGVLADGRARTIRDLDPVINHLAHETVVR